MPNWCYNHIEVHGGDEEGIDRNHFFSESESESTTPLLKYLPISEYHDTLEGYNDGGYEWCLNTWGTKWPERDLCYLGNTGFLDFSFESPWGPPITGYQSISMMFPQFYFVHYWREEGMCFAGSSIYHNGNIVFSRDIDGAQWPEWKDEYEYNDDEYSDKLEEMINNLMEEARRTVEDLMFIE